MPLFRAPSGGGGPHGHGIPDVSGLQPALDGKQAAGSYAASGHNHDGTYHPLVSFVGQGLRLARANVGATAFEFVDATKGLVGLGNVDNTSDASKPVSSATQTALDGKAAIGHNHAGVYEPVISSGQTNQFWRGDKTWAVPSGGSDPWTYVKLASDFTTSSATAVDVTGLAFTPLANTQYEFEAVLLCRTATATVGPRPGVAWPTGGTDGVADIYTTSAAATEVQQHGNLNAAVLGPVGGLPNTTQSWPARIAGTLMAGASPSGTLKIQLASETAGTNVTAKAGSFLKYRTI